jgi:RNA polymerase sigma-70 factor (family 1)
MNPTDEELVSGLKEGQRDAFEVIFRRYWYGLYKSVYARIKSHEEAEEIVQDLFSTIWDKRDSLVIPHLANYLFAASRKRVLNHIRSGAVREKYAAYYLHCTTEEKSMTEETLEYNELSQAVEEIMSRLPEKTQQVFRLSRLEGYSIPELSEYLKLPKRTIGYHLTKSLKEVRMHLKDFILFLAIALLF